MAVQPRPLLLFLFVAVVWLVFRFADSVSSTTAYHHTPGAQQAAVSGLRCPRSLLRIAFCVLWLHARGVVVVAASARCSLRFMLSTRVRASVESVVLIQGHFDSAWAFGRRTFCFGGCPLVLVMRVVFMVGISGGSPAFVTVICVS